MHERPPINSTQRPLLIISKNRMDVVNAYLNPIQVHSASNKIEIIYTNRIEQSEIIDIKY